MPDQGRIRCIDCAAPHQQFVEIRKIRGGNVSLMRTPMQLLDRLAALIPPPRKHRHRYFGVLAPNSPLREAVAALAQPAEDTPAPAMIGASPSDATPTEPAHRQAARYVWALLLARIYEVPLLCPKCSDVRGYCLRTSLRHKMRIIAFSNEGAVIREILGHLGEPISPPRLMPARGPPLCEMRDSGSNVIDPHAQTAPGYAFDQRIAW